MENFSFDAIGTRWEVSLPPFRSSETLMNNIRQRIEDFESTYSRFRDGSLLSKIAVSHETMELPKDAKELFDIYKKFTKLTLGSFTPFIGKTLVEAGYDRDYSFEKKIITKQLVWDEVFEYDFPKLVVKKPVQLDFGAAGKGYIMDIVSKMIVDFGIKDFVVDAGHDLLCGSNVVKVGLEHPNDSTKAIGVAKISNSSICGSSGNRRNWGEFHHIINGNTLSSPKDILATWVIAKNAIVADAISTALFFVKPEVFQKDYFFEYLILKSNSSIEKSANFPGEIFYA